MGETTDGIEMKPVPLVDGPVTFAGAVSLEVDGKEDEEYLADEVHPGGDGMHFVADRFSELVMPELMGKRDRVE